MDQKKILQCQKKALENALKGFFETVIKKAFPEIEYTQFKEEPGWYINIFLRGLDKSSRESFSVSMRAELERINNEVDKILAHLVIEFRSDVAFKFYGNPSRYLEGEFGFFSRIERKIKEEEEEKEKTKKEGNVYFLFD